MFKKILSLTALMTIFLAVNLSAQWVSFKVAASSDDAEEHTTANATEGIGGMEPLTSSDLELCDESGQYNQIVGIRFTGLTIVPGAKIDSAYIQFTVDDDNTGACQLFIHAENTDNSATFTLDNSNISSRDKTRTSQIWDPVPPWTTVGESGVDQRTPDLSFLVQAVIDRPGYALGNPITFIISGTGEREADSWDGDPNTAPELFIKVGIANSVEDKGADVPVTFALNQNYPNPFNPSTTIEFSVAKSGFYSLKVYNLSGQQVADLISDNLSVGPHNIVFESDNLSSGVYIYKLVGENVNISKKMILMK